MQIFKILIIFYLHSLYRQFPAMAPYNSTQEYWSIYRLDSEIEPGLGRTAKEQAGFQIIALVCSKIK